MKSYVSPIPTPLQLKTFLASLLLQKPKCSFVPTAMDFLEFTTGRVLFVVCLVQISMPFIKVTDKSLFLFLSLQGYPSMANADSNIRDPSTVLTEQNSILSLSSNGLLTSHTSTGRAAVIVSSIDETNVRQTLGLSIEVTFVMIVVLISMIETINQQFALFI